MIKEIKVQADIDKVLGFRQKCAKAYGLIPFRDQEEKKFFSADNFVRTKAGFLSAAYYFEHGNEVQACIMAFLYPEFPEMGFVGMFDCIEDENVAHALLEQAKSFLKNHSCKQIIGPFDFSIWHSYRFMTQGFETQPLLSEPRNFWYYPKYFQSFGFKQHEEWITQELDKHEMRSLIAELRPDYDLFEALGYKIYQMTPENKVRLMEQVYEVIVESYKHFPLYSSISKSEFLRLYAHMPQLLDRDCSWFLENPDGRFLGFVLVLKDLYLPLQRMHGSLSILSKIRFLLSKKPNYIATIAQGGSLRFFVKEAAVLGLRQYKQPMRLGAVGLYKSLHAAEKKYEKAAISLMRSEAAIKNYAKALSMHHRRYALFRYEL